MKSLILPPQKQVTTSRFPKDRENDKTAEFRDKLRAHEGKLRGVTARRAANSNVA